MCLLDAQNTTELKCFGKQKQWCVSYTSAAVIKHHDQKELNAEKSL